MSKYKICTSCVSIHMLKRITEPFLFGVFFFLVVFITIHFFKEYCPPFAISFIVLGLMGSFYLCMFFFLGSKDIFYNKVKMDVIDICIVETNSIDYGDKIYFPLIKYKYRIGNHEYISKNVCLDDRSCYMTVWYENEGEHRGLLFAQKKIDKVLSSGIVYSLKLFPSISYLDISFSKKRKIYFFILQIISIGLVIAGLIFCNI